jgi:N-acetyl-anhydromuramyl-L-alanine amidase AmpD
VERDGTIFEVFDPRFWAFHLGLAGTGGSAERRSIGIEMASEGRLEERGEEVGTPGRHFDFDRALFGYRGVLGHHQVRADKTDLHPGFPWDRLVEGARLAVG